VHSGIAFAKALIDSDPSGRHDLRGLARRCGLSQWRFCHLFTKEIGASAGHYSRTARLKDAARLLAQTSHSVKEVAFHIGYLDPSHFSRSFKKLFGVPPVEFRRMRSKNGHDKSLALRS
jgi:transcriptional regulator GlxA family with amidase domain